MTPPAHISAQDQASAAQNPLQHLNAPACTAGHAEGKDRTGHGHMLGTLEGTEPCWPHQQNGGNRAWGMGVWLGPTCFVLSLPHRDTQITRDTRAAPQVLGLDFLCLASQEHQAVPLEYQ